ncbi:MAG: low specificity L-threonine aldolase [Proteobacteria bacterium]|nr:low specificity L-threonine aldolase [Pseudomonadota bacterium]
MSTRLRNDFASDNTAGIAPEAMRALIEANTGFEAAYGADRTTARAADLVRTWLDADAPVHFVSCGTAANAVSIGAMCRSFETVLAHRYAHTIHSEAGAPNAFGHGLSIRALDGNDGKISTAALEAALRVPEDPSRQPPAVLSIANATELGTLYREDELRSLVEVSKARGLAVHVDGARLVNAVAAGFDPRSLRQRGVDVLVIGGTKAGMPASEAIVIFEPRIAHRFDVRLKQAGQVISKSRFLSAPWLGLLSSGRWIELAAHANAMTRRLATLMPFEIVYPVETNAIFVRMDTATHRHLTQLGWVTHRLAEASVRFMCSWATTEDSVDELGAVLARLAAEIDKPSRPVPE